MKAPLKHFFSILLLLAAITVYGQDPDNPVRVKTDTVKVAADTLRTSPGSSVSISDTLRIPVDSLTVLKDTLKTRADSTVVIADTLKVAVDSVQFLPDTTKIPVEARILEDSVNTILKDSIQLAPTDKEARVKVPREKLPKDTIKGPSGIEFYLDYGKLLTLPSEFESKAEGGAAINIWEKFLLLFEIGYGKLSPSEAIKNGEYNSEGIYTRGGVAYGGEIMPKTYLYLGFMYAISKFEDSGTVLIESQAWDDLDKQFSRTGLEATWYEIILVSETEFKKNLFLGSKWRLRFHNTFDNDYYPDVYSIPGFGRTFDNSIPAINVYIKYRFAF